MAIRPIPPLQRTTFSGMRMVVLCAIIFAMTGPGQTLGVSVFIDPIMAELGLSRGRISGAYLIGTLCSAATVPFIGRGVDRFGIRPSMAVAGAGFAIALLALSQVSGVVTLVLGFIAIRMLGQSSLSLISTNALAPWFERRRGRAIGVTSAAGTLLMAVIPIAATFVMARLGWRLTRAALGLLVLATVVPIALFGIISRPSDVGQLSDGPRPFNESRAVPRSAATTARPVELSMTRAEALRDPLFWAISGGLIVTGIMTTALFFHQIDILGEQGLTPLEAAANFVPQTAAGLVAMLAVGSLADRVRPHVILWASMALMAGAMLAVPYISPGLTAHLYGVALGLAASSAKALEAAAIPRYFGIRHLGAIRGATFGIASASTALGPLLLSFGLSISGSYVPVLRLLTVLPLTVAVVGFFASEPDIPGEAAVTRDS